MRLLSRLRIADRVNPPVNVVISNVPGPNHPLYSAGAELKHFYPVSTISDGIGLNLTVQSYNGQLDFGFVGDRELVPDVWILVDLLHDSMQELYERAMAEHDSASAAPLAADQAPAKKAGTKKAATKKAATRTATGTPAVASEDDGAKKTAAKKAVTKSDGNQGRATATKKASGRGSRPRRHSRCSPDGRRRSAISATTRRRRRSCSSR